MCVLTSLTTLFDDRRNQKDVQLTLRLLDYARYLRRAISDVYLDYSSIHAVSNWIVDALKTCSSSFAVVANHANALQSAISLSSGLGIAEIWFTFLPTKVNSTEFTELKHLEDGVRNVKDISKTKCSSLLTSGDG